jgi:hypothetical protein
MACNCKKGKETENGLELVAPDVKSKIGSILMTILNRIVLLLLILIAVPILAIYLIYNNVIMGTDPSFKIPKGMKFNIEALKNTNNIEENND